MMTSIHGFIMYSVVYIILCIWFNLGFVLGVHVISFAHLPATCEGGIICSLDVLPPVLVHILIRSSRNSDSECKRSQKIT